MRRVVVRMLQTAGYDVLEAGDLESTRAAFGAADRPVDLLLTDVVLADTTGPELAVLLQKEQRTLEVLYMSGLTDKAIVHHGVLDEGPAFIEKPFRPADLLRKVWEVLSDGSEGAAGAA